MSAFVLLAALAQAAAPPSAPQGAAPPPEFIAAAQAFGTCLKDSAAKAPASATPEDGATQAIAACATQRTELDTRFNGWINGPTFPEAGRAIAQQSFKAEMDKLPLTIADGLRQGRAAPGASTTPAPSPTSNPTPNK